MAMCYHAMMQGDLDDKGRSLKAVGCIKENVSFYRKSMDTVYNGEDHSDTCVHQTGGW